MTYILYIFCPTCGATSQYQFVEIDNGEAVYLCDGCGNMVRYAVRNEVK
jgi:uncharacterized Zn finger protein